MAEQTCPVCHSQCETALERRTHTLSVKCVRCGGFTVDQDFVDDHPHRSPPGDWHRGRKSEWRLPLSGAIRQATDLDPKQGIVERIEEGNFEELAARFREPSGALAQVDRLLVEIDARTPFLGANTPPESHLAWAARLGLSRQHDLECLNKELAQLGWFDWGEEDGTDCWYRLKHPGFERAAEFRRKHGPGNQAFVAMWFSKGLTPAYADAIGPALREVGYSPYRVDFDSHNEPIDDKIIAEIRRSRIVLAECTGIRPSVYFEAGFAMGLGAELIWTCFDESVVPDGQTPFAAPRSLDGGSWFERLAFDTRQYPFLQWATLTQLKEKIVDRVRARGLDRGALPSA
jgi:hypothetical protein